MRDGFHHGGVLLAVQDRVEHDAQRLVSVVFVTNGGGRVDEEAQEALAFGGVVVHHCQVDHVVDDGLPVGAASNDLNHVAKNTSLPFFVFNSIDLV